MTRVLFKICFRLSRRHPLRTALMTIGIAIGVAGMIAIDISKTSITKSFELSTSALISRSTHQIVGSNFTIPQHIFTQLRTQLGIKASAPVITRHVKTDQLGNNTFTLMGIDPFSEIHFRSFETIKGLNSRPMDLSSGRPGVLISRRNARQFNVKLDRPIYLRLGNKEIKTIVAGFIDTGDVNSRNPADGVILTDIATAQELLELGDNITRIDLLLHKDDIDKVRQILPKGVFLVETNKRNQVVRGLSRSFETSLTAFSMLALFMGIFLIYNTVSFSVARRRHINGTLKALGASGRQIFLMVILEVFLFSLVGSILGALLGVGLGKGAVNAVCSTVSDMYFVLTVSQAHISSMTILKGVLAGITASFLASIFPALKASRAIPITLMQRSASERAVQNKIPVFMFTGLLLISCAIMIFKVIALPPAYDFIGVFILFLGSSFLAPGLVLLISRACSGLVKKYGKVLFKMAARNVVRSLSRTSVLIASLMVVVSVFIGIEIMTKSFRASIETWVDGHIGGDIHVSSTDELDRRLDFDLLDQIRKLPQVKDLSAYNIHRIYSVVAGEVHIFSYIKDLSEKQWTWTVQRSDKMETFLEQGWILVSEIFARKHSFNPENGDSVTLETIQGPVRFKIAGVFRDFFMGGGRAVVSRDVMKKYWGLDDITSIQIFLNSTDEIEPTIHMIKKMIPETKMVKVVSGLSIKQSILSVFDKTFVITTALQILTAIVAFTGILNSVMALLIERKKELGILRACGAKSDQVGRLMIMECGINGFISGVLALPLGIFLAWVLIDIINQRSFGWSYDMVLSMGILLQALLLSVGAAGIAGIIPAFQAGKTNISRALHME